MYGHALWQTEIIVTKINIVVWFLSSVDHRANNHPQACTMHGYRTEFQNCIPSCARATEDVRHELIRKNCIMEGIRRWQRCLCTVKSDTDISFTSGYHATVGNVPDSSVPQNIKFKAVYCNSKFERHTNIPCFMELNRCLTLTQLSTSDLVDTEQISLNVPRLDSRQ